MTNKALLIHLFHLKDYFISILILPDVLLCTSLCFITVHSLLLFGKHRHAWICH